MMMSNTDIDPYRERGKFQMSSKSKNNTATLWATILGIIIFIAFFVAQRAISGIIRSGNATPLISGMTGILSQLQVLAIVIMIVIDGKRGFITGMSIQIFSLLSVFFQVFAQHNTKVIPGIATNIVSLIMFIIIYYHMEKNRKLHDELTDNYEKLIEQNHMIEDKDKTLTQLAYYDRMTGLPNRAFFADKLQEYIENGTPFAVIHMDMDNFKQINDNFGHQCGDELIKVYSDRFEKYCGTKYTCSKIGGDEFGMILIGRYTEADILNIVEQLRTLFSEPVQLNAGNFSITMSYGICGYPNDGGTPDNLITAAETALYNAKIAGKNRPCFYSQNSLG
jgi:diguanylate cyclase (GGDEF)-like protein